MLPGFSARRPAAAKTFLLFRRRLLQTAFGKGILHSVENDNKEDQSLKKFISILIVLALCVSLCAVASAEEDWTIFVYLCGADLESENSMATHNM